VIRRFVLRALLAVHSEVQDALVARIAGQAEVTARAAWIDLAVQLNATHALFESARHATDNDPGVRAAVARALGSLPSASSLDALTRLVIDPVETVRAAAARSVGRLGSVRGTDILGPTLRDPVWAVRYAAAIAMAQLGERGRTVLLALRDDGDRYVSEIATVVSGLSDGALFELSVD
jgi:HEAT repeat protein